MRRNDGTGFCGETDRLRVAYVGPHFGEEPPLTGDSGSGTIFFTGCSLRCSFCQNFQISHQGKGDSIEMDALLVDVEKMIRFDRVHNINFVTPDHFFPHVFRLVYLLREKGCELPMVYNLSGYQSVEMLKTADDYSDIYLPDFKYSDSDLAAGLSRCRDYPQKALEAITEMVLQKGFLDACSSQGGTAEKGVLVRHLILPGNVENSINALTMLFTEFGSGLPVSLMSQYFPVSKQKFHDLNRRVSQREFDQVYSHARDLGFEYLFVQFPEPDRPVRAEDLPFLPDFTMDKPFK